MVEYNEWIYEMEIKYEKKWRIVIFNEGPLGFDAGPTYGVWSNNTNTESNIQECLTREKKTTSYHFWQMIAIGDEFPAPRWA